MNGTAAMRFGEWVQTEHEAKHWRGAFQTGRFCLAIVVSVLLGTMLTPPWTFLNFWIGAAEHMRETQRRQEKINESKTDLLNQKWRQ
jgi:hypothetical protein